MKKKIWVASVMTIAVLGLGYGAYKKNQKPAVNYAEVAIRRGSVSISILSTGTVQPENRLEIKPPIAGRVDQVLVKEGQKVSKGQILAWMSSTERAALLDSARSKGPDEVKRWEEMYRPTPVVAPISGTIILRNVESGQTFTNTDAILVMSDRLTVKAQVDETDIAQIKLKEPAEIVLDAYSGQKLPARVDQIAFEAKTVNNVTTYVVDVLPDSTPPFMRAGMTANVTFFVETRENVLVAPTEAIKTEAGTSTVTVKGADGMPIEKTVQIGISDGKKTEIISGLAEGDVLLTAQINLKSTKGQQNSSPFSPIRPRGPGKKS